MDPHPTTSRARLRPLQWLGLVFLCGPLGLVFLLYLAGAGQSEGGAMGLVILAFGAIFLTLFVGAPVGLALLTGSLSWKVPLLPMVGAIAIAVLTQEPLAGLVAGGLIWIPLHPRDRSTDENEG